MRLEQGFARFSLLLWIFVHIWRLWPTHFNPAWSLPLHLCDLMTLLVPLTLLGRQRRWISLLYFLGLALSLQGLLTPDVQHGLLHPEFWLFWFDHASIVGTAIYMVVVHQFRPTRRDYYWAVQAGLMYVIFVFPIDAIWGFNYGYLGNAYPNQPTLIDWLGPWPWRVGVMVVLAGLVMFLLLLPWERQRHKSSLS